MAMSEYLEEAFVHGDFDGDNIYSAKNRKSKPEAVLASDFDCNICLDSVQDPVVTLCGHLYCWACIYKWLCLHIISTGDEDQQSHKQCPVCKAEVSSRTLVPLFGQGQTTIKREGKDILIPRRPIGPVYRYDMSRSLHASGNLRLSQRIHLNYPHAHGTQRGSYTPVLSASMMSSSPSTVIDPLVVMIGDMVCARLFGTQVTDANHTYLDGYSIGPRMRRRMMQADKSLSRICFFLMCCVILCLLVF